MDWHTSAVTHTALCALEIQAPGYCTVLPFPPDSSDPFSSAQLQGAFERASNYHSLMMNDSHF